MRTLTEPAVCSPQRAPSTSSDRSPNAEVQPYLSSVAAGWPGIIVQAFYEPREMEEWLTPGMPGVVLSLYTGGSLHFAWQQAQATASWTVTTLHSSDLILNAGASHVVRWSSCSPLPTHRLSLLLCQDLLARIAAEIAEMTDAKPFELALVERAGFQDPFLEQVSVRLWHELQQDSSPSPVSSLFAQSAAHLLALHLLRQYTTHPTQGIKAIAAGRRTQRLTPLQMQRILDYVQSHHGQDIFLEALAQQTGYSLSHFARLFRETTGETPHDFVLHQRIAYAQRLLKETLLPIGQIAVESGFANQSHFTRVFRAQLGMPPRAFRLECSR